MSDYSSKIIDEMLEKLDDEKLKNIYRLMRIEYIMPELGEVHNMLARTSLSKSEYQPISTKLGQNIYNHKILDVFDFGSNRIRRTGVICP
jgi:hypothetical protein